MFWRIILLSTAGSKSKINKKPRRSIQQVKLAASSSETWADINRNTGHYTPQ
jgi:hypothetical protein